VKRLAYLDSGFVNFKNNIQSEYIKLDDLNDLYRGKIAEQIVGQNIIAGGLHSEQDLYYWAKEKPQASAEVDFCVAYQGKIIGIEVKSGHSAKLKSILNFAQSVENCLLIRIYSGLMKEEIISGAGRQYGLISLPFYLVNRLFDFKSS
jgi:predicted AAA+ superfamily ATPase